MSTPSTVPARDPSPGRLPPPEILPPSDPAASFRLMLALRPFSNGTAEQRHVWALAQVRRQIAAAAAHEADGLVGHA